MIQNSLPLQEVLTQKRDTVNEHNKYKIGIERLMTGDPSLVFQDNYYYFVFILIDSKPIRVVLESS